MQLPFGWLIFWWWIFFSYFCFDCNRSVRHSLDLFDFISQKSINSSKNLCALWIVFFFLFYTVFWSLSMKLQLLCECFICFLFDSIYKFTSNEHWALYGTLVFVISLFFLFFSQIMTGTHQKSTPVATSSESNKIKMQ